MVISHWLKIKLVKLFKKKKKKRLRPDSCALPSLLLSYSQLQHAKEYHHIPSTIYNLELKRRFHRERNNRINLMESAPLLEANGKEQMVLFPAAVNRNWTILK